MAAPTGLSNFSTAPPKSTRITESKEPELRFEAFNLFNHAQFMNSAGEIYASPFELVTGAHDPRIRQIGAKFLF